MFSFNFEFPRLYTFLDRNTVLFHLDDSPIPHLSFIQLLHGSRNAIFGHGELLYDRPDIMFGSESQHSSHGLRMRAARPNDTVPIHQQRKDGHRPGIEARGKGKHFRKRCQHGNVPVETTSTIRTAPWVDGGRIVSTHNDRSGRTFVVIRKKSIGSMPSNLVTPLVA